MYSALRLLPQERKFASPFPEAVTVAPPVLQVPPELLIDSTY